MNTIKRLRKQKGLTQLELANLLNVHQTAVSQWEQDRTSPDIETYKHMASIFDVSLDLLLGNKELKGIKIPVLGRVQAGIPIEAVTEIIDYEEITPELAATGEFFCLQIQGDSMEPRFVAGDVVVVKRQPDIESGDIAVVLVNGHDATVKKVKKTEDGLMLIPTNPQYEPTFYSNIEIAKLPVEILGRVIELRGKF